MRILRSKNAPPPSAGGGNTPDSAEPGHTSLPTYATPGDSPPGPWSRLPGRRAGWVWQHLSPVSQSLPPLPSPSSPLHWSTRPPPPTSPVSRTPVTITHTHTHTHHNHTFTHSTCTHGIQAHNFPNCSPPGHFWWLQQIAVHQHTLSEHRTVWYSSIHYNTILR